MTDKEFDIQLALGSLSDDDRIGVAENPNTPEKALMTLSKDEDRGVSTFALYRIVQMRAELR